MAVLLSSICLWLLSNWLNLGVTWLDGKEYRISLAIWPILLLLIRNSFVNPWTHLCHRIPWFINISVAYWGMLPNWFRLYFVSLMIFLHGSFSHSVHWNSIEIKILTATDCNLSYLSLAHIYVFLMNSSSKLQASRLIWEQCKRTYEQWGLVELLSNRTKEVTRE